MTQWGFYFDQTRCYGCKTCTVACKEWNEGRRGDAKINELKDLPQYETPENGRPAVTNLPATLRCCVNST